MIPQRIDPAWTPDELAAAAAKWRISCELAIRLAALAAVVPFQISIISGWRSREEQADQERQGRPAAPFELSTHTSCPVATGADLSVSVAVTRVVKATLGAGCLQAGLRWGGGSPADSGGIPSDWNHVDLGPRNG